MPSPRPGDFFLVHGSGPVQRMIQFGQRLRFPKEDARWNHAGLFISEDGEIIEALTSKVTADNFDKYDGMQTHVVSLPITDADRIEMLAFAQWALNQSYGFMTDANLALWCLFGGKFTFGLDDQMICSGLVAQALERAGYIFQREASHVMPADLAKQFNVPGIVK